MAVLDLAARFRQLRAEAGLSGAALARPRYTVSYVSQIEAGRRKPSPEALQFFAERLGVSSEYLATGVPEGLEVSLRYRLEEARRLLTTSQTEAAESVLRSLIEQAREHGMAKLESMAQSSLGVAMADQGRFREAIDNYELALAGELPRVEVGRTVARLGSAYRSAGDPGHARDIIKSFLSRCGGEPLDPKVATDLHSILISIHYELGHVVEAERAARTALAALDELTPPDVRAVAYWNASRILAENKLWDEALDLSTRARILMEEVEDRRNVGRLHNAFAFICLEAEPPRIDEARLHLDASEDLLRTWGTRSDLAYLYSERARLSLLEDRPDEALSFADFGLADPDLEELEVGRGLYVKGRALALLGRRREATETLKRAAEMFDRIGARQQQASCWREVGEMELAAGDLHAAVESLRAGLEALDPRRSRA